MLATKEVDREALLTAISKGFFGHLRARMVGDIRRGVRPESTGKINVEIVLNGLELAKEHLSKHFQCREDFLFARAEPLKGTSWADQSRRVHGWKMMEYLLDLSISVGPIPVAIDDWAGPQFAEGERFELLFGAESEMNSDGEVLRDLLKLLDTKCRMKVLLFEARKDPLPLKQGLERLLQLHASRAADDIWLFLGIPNYAMWYHSQDNLAQVPRHIYMLSDDGAMLIDRGDLWPFK